MTLVILFVRYVEVSDCIKVEHIQPVLLARG
jgi:hypothetical protein